MAINATLVKSSSGLEYRKSLALPAGLNGLQTAVPAGATNEFTFDVLDRKVRFREVGVIANQTVVSGHPLTNHFRLEWWHQSAPTNFAGATKFAQATITGASTGTQLRRNVYVTVATLNQMLQSNAEAAARSVITVKFVGTQTLSRGFRGQALAYGDYVD